MDDMKSLIIGIVGTLIVMFGVRIFNAHRRKSLKDDIDLIELELQVLDKMKRSSVEMNRASFRGLYALLFLFGISNVIEITFDWLNVPALEHIKHILSFTVWAAFIALAWIWWDRYENLKNYPVAVKRLNEKKAKKEVSLSKLDK
ncbi:hypothetical protein F0241_20045 [Vibrio kanaloae]|uniref:hypothetical protein n=1 Tax=Vibrio kanaloae TaxID=170673 RepID=UPI00148E3513|nr:hypothetical protein [Vibrio kanaloae]NOI03376.1 hypothetical protein [Vibrio kanaloae]